MAMPIGPHVNRYHAKGARPSIVAHIEAARAEAAHEAAFEVTAVAVFVGGPRSRAITLRPDERKELREYCARTGLRVVAHSSYVAQPWRGDPEAARYIREEQRVCQEAGIEGLVVHLPKLPPDAVLRHAGAILEPGAPDVQLYLETPATRPAESLYETPAKLAALFRALRAALPDLAPRFGLCVDTAHLSTSGVDLRSRAAAEAWLAALEAEADAFPRVMLHLNDSLRPLGVGPDAHAPLAEGKMWEAYRSRLDESGLAAFVEWARRRGAPTILERKPREALRRDYLTLRKLLPPPEPEPEP